MAVLRYNVHIESGHLEILMYVPEIVITIDSDFTSSFVPVFLRAFVIFPSLSPDLVLRQHKSFL